MSKSDCIIKESVAPLYSKPTFKSELISQALIWEQIHILDKKKNWYKIKQWDKYVSWIHDSYISLENLSDSSFKNYSWFFLNDSIKLKNTLFSFGSLVPVVKSKNKKDTFKLLLPNFKTTYVSKNFLINPKDYVTDDDLINYALNLKGVPYLWGGKSSFGYDCSGFIQSLLRLKGINLPRDCSEQVKSSLIKTKTVERIDKNDLIYFREKSKSIHVGLFINSNEFIHCSGSVKINSIDKNNKLYSDKLAKLDFNIFSLKK